MKRTILLLCIMLLGVSMANAQFLNRLNKAAKNAAENSTERNTTKNIDRKVEKGVDAIFDGGTYKSKNKPAAEEIEKGWTCSCGHSGNTGKFCTECGKKQPSEDDGKWTCPSCGHKGNTGKFCVECGAKKDGAETASASDNNTDAAADKPQNTRAIAKYNKFDFVAGDQIIFEDNLAKEQLGEFPSQWDLVGGVAEIAEVDGQKVIAMESGAKIRPFMEPIHDYLGDVFTIEFDYYQFLELKGEDYGGIYFYLQAKDRKDIRGTTILQLSFNNFYHDGYYHNNYSGASTTDYSYRWKSTSDEHLSGNNDALDVGPNNWVHVSISFNKRALKMYVNETRIANIPNMSNQSGFLYFNYVGAADGFPAYIRNIRIAKGAVPLYDRMMTDGKFITYGITFDVGKSTIKDESMGEINRIVKLMTDNPDLKFSVEGHTDNTGNAATNQTLSEARSKAIVDKLVEMGISKERLASVGKGQATPIADNATDEGRAKNRRVEFVKM